MNPIYSDLRRILRDGALQVQDVFATGKLAWKVITAILVFVFANEWQVYAGLGGLVLIDTLTGSLAAYKRKSFNSRTFRLKFIAKMLAYLMLLSAFGLFQQIVMRVPGIDEVLKAILTLVISGIGLAELRSIIENVKTLTGHGVKIIKPQEILDYLESNHVQERISASEPDGSNSTLGKDPSPA